MLVDLLAHAGDQGLLNFCHFVWITFHSRYDHISGFLLALLHVPIESILKLIHFLLNKRTGLLVRNLTVPGTLLQRFRWPRLSSLIVTFHCAAEAFPSHFSHVVSFNVVQDFTGFALHLGVEGVGLSLDLWI